MADKVHHNAERGARHLSDLTGGDGFPTNGIAEGVGAPAPPRGLARASCTRQDLQPLQGLHPRRSKCGSELAREKAGSLTRITQPNRVTQATPDYPAPDSLPIPRA